MKGTSYKENTLPAFGGGGGVEKRSGYWAGRWGPPNVKVTEKRTRDGTGTGTEKGRDSEENSRDAKL